jgi:hypothetical protein
MSRDVIEEPQANKNAKDLEEEINDLGRSRRWFTRFFGGHKAPVGTADATQSGMETAH